MTLKTDLSKLSTIALCNLRAMELLDMWQNQLRDESVIFALNIL